MTVYLLISILRLGVVLDERKDQWDVRACHKRVVTNLWWDYASLL